MTGYQRPEVQDHINEIRGYVERSDAILPNSIVIAFQDALDFVEIERIDDESSVGTLHIPVTKKEKSGHNKLWQPLAAKDCTCLKRLSQRLSPDF